METQILKVESKCPLRMTLIGLSITASWGIFISSILIQIFCNSTPSAGKTGNNLSRISIEKHIWESYSFKINKTVISFRYCLLINIKTIPCMGHHNKRMFWWPTYGSIILKTSHSFNYIIPACLLRHTQKYGKTKIL